MNCSKIAWNAHRHAAASIGKDAAGSVWVCINHHPDSPEKARERAVAVRADSVSRSGALFVRLDWVRAEYDRAIEDATAELDTHKVIALTHSRDIGLPVFERQAPDAPTAD